MVEIRLLGRFAVRRDGEEIPPTAFGRRLVRTLVRLLVTRRGEFVSHDVAAEALWPGRLPADPVANLQVLVTRARRALGDPSLILTGSGGYSFAADERCVVDAELFLEAVTAGRERLAGGESGAALPELRQALDRWGGEPLAEDAYEDWAQEYRARLIRAHLQALEDAAAAALAVGDATLAVTLAEQAVGREPLRESAHLLLARSLAASGERVAALRTLDSFRRQLVEDTGLDPSADLREVEHRILEEPPVAPGVRRQAASPRAGTFSELTFVGRDEEFETLLAAVSGPVPGTALLCGSPGAGKTRLLAEVAARCSVPVLSVRANMAERDLACSLARSLLSEAVSFDVDVVRALPARAAEALADILPDVAEVRPIGAESIDPESRRALALEAAVRVVAAAADTGMVLLVDDLQWADATSLRLVELTLARARQLGVVLAYRPEEVDPDGAVASFLANISTQHGDVVTVAPGPLSPDALFRLIADRELIDVIAAETDGTPLALSELLRALAARSVVEQDRDGRWAPSADDVAETARELARSGQRRSIAARAARQPRRRRDALSLLALLRRETAARVVALALATDQATVLDDLDALTRAALVRLGDAGWAPAHDLVGETVSDGLARAERGRLHHNLARALIAEGGDPAQIGEHLAGAGDRAAAAAAYAKAARERLDRFAGAEARRLAEAGLGLDPEPTVRAALVEARAEARAISGDRRGARADLRSLLPTRRSGPDRARFQARMALLTLAEDFGQAAELAELAITEAKADPAARAGALVIAAFIDLSTGRLDRAEARSTEALALFEQLGDAGGVAQALDAWAGIAFNRGRILEAADLYDRAARRYLDSGKLLLAGTPRSFRGWTLIMAGRPDEALLDIDDALQLERTLGQREGEAIALMVRAEALCALGHVEEARRTAHEALALSRRLGNREWECHSLRILGQVDEGAGNLELAEAALRQAVEMSAAMPVHGQMAAGRLASLHLAQGDIDSAKACAHRALAEGIPLGGFEAGLVLAEIALLEGDPDAETTVAAALARADAGGYVESPARRRLERMGWRAVG